MRIVRWSFSYCSPRRLSWFGQRLVQQDKQASSILPVDFRDAQMAINFFSIDGREAFSNRACQEMLGCTEQELSQVWNWEES